MPRSRRTSLPQHGHAAPVEPGADFAFVRALSCVFGFVVFGLLSCLAIALAAPVKTQIYARDLVNGYSADGQKMLVALGPNAGFTAALRRADVRLVKPVSWGNHEVGKVLAVPVKTSLSALFSAGLVVVPISVSAGCAPGRSAVQSAAIASDSLNNFPVMNPRPKAKPTARSDQANA